MNTIRYVPVGAFTFNPSDLFAKEPAQRAVSAAEMDTYKAPAPLSRKTSKDIMADVASDIQRLGALAGVTAPIKKRLDSLEAKCAGRALSRDKLFDLRKDIYECEKEITALRKQGLKDALEAVPQEVRAKLQMLSVLQTISDGDFDAAKEMLGDPQHQHVTKGENEMLRVLDDGLLRTFTGMGICISTTLGERREREDAINQSKSELLEAKKSTAKDFWDLGREEAKTREYDKAMALHRAGQAKLQALKHINAELENLEVQTWQLNRQVFCGNRYYSVVPSALPLMEGLSSLAQESGLKILSRTRLENQVLESLYTEPLRKLIDFGLIERVASSQLTTKPREGFVNRVSVTHVDGAYYRLAISGLRMLKDVFPSREMVEAKPPVAKVKEDDDFAFDVEFY